MYRKVNVTDNIFHLGVNDRRKELFENLWPLPNGVSYNSYLINDEKTALVDTIEMGTGGDFTGWVASILAGKPLDYLIINHMEPDHSGEIGNIVRAYPNVKIIGNSKTFTVLKAYYGITENLLEVKDGDTVELGTHTLTFTMTPWVHWPETMMTHDTEKGILFSGDAFGTFGTLDGGIFDDELDFRFYEDDMLRYYSNIVGKYSGMVQKALAKLSSIDIKIICPVHGPVWRSNPAQVLGLYDRWSRQEGENGVVIVYGSMYGNNARVADYIARGFAEEGVRRIRVYDASKTHMSYIVRDAWRYKGIVLGSCAYNTAMFPLMESLTREFEHIAMKNKHLGVFGTYSWNGGGVRNLMDFAGRIGWDLVCEPCDVHGCPNDEKVGAAEAIYKNMSKFLKD